MEGGACWRRQLEEEGGQGHRHVSLYLETSLPSVSQLLSTLNGRPSRMPSRIPTLPVFFKGSAIWDLPPSLHFCSKQMLFTVSTTWHLVGKAHRRNYTATCNIIIQNFYCAEKAQAHPFPIYIQVQSLLWYYFLSDLLQKPRAIWAWGASSKVRATGA